MSMEVKYSKVLHKSSIRNQGVLLINVRETLYDSNKLV